MLRCAALILILSGILFAQDVREVHKTLPLSAKGSVTLENHKGSIRITTWNRPEVEIQARIEAEPGTAMNRRRFEATEIVIDSSQDSVHIQTKYPDFACCSWDDGTNPHVRYTIRMPRTARLALRDHRSDTEISDLAAELDIDTHRGTVHVYKHSGPLRLTTHRGDVKVEFATFSGASTIETHRGTIELDLPKNSKFDLETDLGRHAYLDSDFARIVHSSSRAGEALRSTVNGGGPTLRIQTYRGDIRLRTL
jgi:hypothetical protein